LSDLSKTTDLLVIERDEDGVRQQDTLSGIALAEGVSMDDLMAEAKSGNLFGDSGRADLIAAMLSDGEPTFTADSREVNDLLREKAVSMLIGQWAQTSNDSEPLSLAMQDAAQREFGLTGTVPFQVVGTAEAQQTADGLTERSGSTYQDFVRTQYDQTQSALKDEGLNPNDTVTLYRGTEQELDEPGARMEIAMRPLSSFTPDPDVARLFTIDKKPDSPILKSEVPVSQILSIPSTGVGCLNEKEVVLLGNVGQAEVTTPAVESPM
jgi:hypothetical protein